MYSCCGVRARISPGGGQRVRAMPPVPPLNVQHVAICSVRFVVCYTLIRTYIKNLVHGTLAANIVRNLAALPRITRSSCMKMIGVSIRNDFSVCQHV